MNSNTKKNCNNYINNNNQQDQEQKQQAGKVKWILFLIFWGTKAYSQVIDGKCYAYIGLLCY